MSKEQENQPDEPTPAVQPQETVLHTAGSIPGIPGTHAPGRYIIDWVERTLTRIEDAIEHKPAEAQPTPDTEQVAPTPEN